MQMPMSCKIFIIVLLTYAFSSAVKYWIMPDMPVKESKAIEFTVVEPVPGKPFTIIDSY